MSRLGEYDLKRGSIALVLATVMLLSVVGLGFVGTAAAQSTDLGADEALIAPGEATSGETVDEQVITIQPDDISGETLGNDGEDEISITYADGDSPIGSLSDGDVEVEIVEASDDGEIYDLNDEGVSVNNDEEIVIDDLESGADLELSNDDIIRIHVDEGGHLDLDEVDDTELEIVVETNGDNLDAIENDDIEWGLDGDAPIEVDKETSEYYWSFEQAAAAADSTGDDILVGDLTLDEWKVQPGNLDDGLATATLGGGDDLTIEPAEESDEPEIQFSADGGTLLDVDDAADVEISDIEFTGVDTPQDSSDSQTPAATAVTGFDANDIAITENEFTDFDDTTIDVGTANDGLNISDNTFDTDATSDYTAIELTDTDSEADIDLGVEDAGNDISDVDSADAIVVSDMDEDSTLGINATEISDVDGETAIDIDASDAEAEVTIDDAEIDDLDGSVTAVNIDGTDDATVTLNDSDLTGPGIGEDNSVGVEEVSDLDLSLTNNDISSFEKQLTADGEIIDILPEDVDEINSFGQLVEVLEEEGGELKEETLFGSIDAAVSVSDDTFVGVADGDYDHSDTIEFDEADVTLQGPESETAGVDLDGDVTIEDDIDVNGNDIEIAGVEIDADADEIIDVDTGEDYEFTVHNTSIVGADDDTLIDADTDDGELTVEHVELDSEGDGPGILIDDENSDAFTIYNSTFTGDGLDDGTGLEVDDTHSDDIEDLTIEDNTFEANEKHVDADGIDGTNLGDLLDTNEFVEAAIVFDEEGGSFDADDDAIHGSIDEAATGGSDTDDFINVSAATYDEDVTLDTDDITVYGPANETTHTQIDTEDNAVIAGKTTINEDLEVAGFVFEASDGETEAVQTGSSAQGKLTNSVVTNASDESDVTGIDFDDAGGTFDVEDVHVGAFDGASGFSTGIEDSEGSHAFEVTRSTISYNEQGVLVDDGADNTEINNNTIVDNTEDAIELDNSNNLDARYNYFGEDDGIVGPNAVDNNNVTESQGDLFYEPLLTVEHTEIEESDVSETVDYAFDLTVEDGGQGEFAPVGFSGQSDQELGEAFSDFDGVIYEWDAEEERFDSLDSDDADREVDTLEAFIASPADGEDVIVNIEIEDDAATPSPASTNLEPGWNFVASGSERNADHTQSLSVLSSDTKEVFAYSDNPSSIAGGSGFTTDVQRDDGSGVSTSPFVGYFVFVEDDTPLSSQVSENTNAEDVQDDENLNLDTP